jgi:hypothetical protein
VAPEANLIHTKSNSPWIERAAHVQPAPDEPKRIAWDLPATLPGRGGTECNERNWFPLGLVAENDSHCDAPAQLTRWPGFAPESGDST